MQLVHNNIEATMSALATKHDQPTIVDGLQKVFVYGTLKSAEAAHGFLRYSKYMGNCSIPGVMLNLGRFPGLVDHAICRVTGEVYEIDWATLQNLDGYESAPAFYHRRQVDTPFGKAWTYYKNNTPPLSDMTICVDRGIWRGGATDRCSYGSLLDYFQNKRWNEPSFRLGPQPIIPAEITKSHEEQVKSAVAKAVEEVKVVNLLDHKQQKADEAKKPEDKPEKVVVIVGPGTEEL